MTLTVVRLGLIVLGISVPTSAMAAPTTQAASTTLPAYRLVLLVVGPQQMTFQGQAATWEQLPRLLEQLPDRATTIFQIGAASEQMTVGQFDAARTKAAELCRQFGFQRLSYVGVHPLGSMPAPDHDQVIDRQHAYGEMAVLQTLALNGELALERDDVKAATALVEKMIGRERAVMAQTRGTEFEPLARAVFEEVRRFLAANEKGDVNESLAAMGAISSYCNIAVRMIVPPAVASGALANEDPRLTQLRQARDLLDRQLVQAREKLGENHPLLQEMKRRRNLYQQEMEQLQASSTTQAATRP